MRRWSLSQEDENRQPSKCRTANLSRPVFLCTSHLTFNFSAARQRQASPPNSLQLSSTHFEIVGTSNPLSMLSWPAGTATESSNFCPFGCCSLSLSKACLSSCSFQVAVGAYFRVVVVVVFRARFHQIQFKFKPGDAESKRQMTPTMDVDGGDCAAIVTWRQFAWQLICVCLVS